jgi:Spy/CpxP family protein refolding chaperone
MKHWIAFAALIVVTTVASARPHHRPGALPESLALTPGQEAAWEKLEEEFRATVHPLHQRMQALHEQLETMLDGADPTAVGTLMLQIHSLHGQIRSARAEADGKFVPLLTPEQRERFNAFRTAEDVRRRRGPGGGGRRP